MRRVLFHGLAAATLALSAGGAFAQPQERCYGVAQAGANDGIGKADRPGGSKVAFQGDAWVWVPRGTCLTIALPVQPDGTPRRGALQPLERDLP